MEKKKVFRSEVEPLIPGDEIFGWCDYDGRLVLPTKLKNVHQVSYRSCLQYLISFSGHCLPEINE